MEGMEYKAGKNGALSKVYRDGETRGEAVISAMTRCVNKHDPVFICVIWEPTKLYKMQLNEILTCCADDTSVVLQMPLREAKAESDLCCLVCYRSAKYSCQGLYLAPAH